MRKAASVLLVALALGAAGCGDSPENVLRDVITFRNELADEALRVTDAASAKETNDGRLKKMKDRQEAIKYRLDQVKEDKKKLKLFFEALEQNADEIMASAKYVASAQTWLEAVQREGGGQEVANVSSTITTLATFTLPQAPPPTSKQGNPGG